MSKAPRSACPVARSLELIGDRWTLLIVRDLACGKSHFKELCESPERIATNILAARLERLIGHGLVETYPSACRPGRDAYRLTPKGRSLAPVLDAIVAWGLQNIEGTAALMMPKF